MLCLNVTAVCAIQQGGVDWKSDKAMSLDLLINGMKFEVWQNRISNTGDRVKSYKISMEEQKWMIKESSTSVVAETSDFDAGVNAKSDRQYEQWGHQFRSYPTSQP